MNTTSTFLDPSLYGAFNTFPDAGAAVTRRFAEIDSMVRGELPGIGRLDGPDVARSMGDAFDMAALEAMLQRTVSTGIANFPVRENLEAPARLLFPVRTPVRNRIPRVMGEGVAALWRTIPTFGTGFGTTTAADGSGSSSTALVVLNANGFAAGETVLIGASASRVISAVNYATRTLTLATAASWTDGDAVTKTSLYQPGGGVATQSFFGETGAPATKVTQYLARSANYRLMGELGAVTGFAMSTGRNFQDQYEREKENRLMSVMLSEENALINARAGNTLPPWGDGTTAFAYNGLIAEALANAPANQVQTSVGALTMAHLDAQIARLYYNGAEGIYLVMNGQELISLSNLTQATGSILRIYQMADDMTLGRRVTKLLHPLAGEIDLLFSPFMPAGTILFLADRLPDGSPGCEVDVLPQVALPDLAPNEPIQGYVVQTLAPAATSPLVYPFVVSVFSVLKVKGYPQIAISTGVTAVT